jgi:Short C-terminal domain
VLNPFTHRKVLKKGKPGRANIVAMGVLNRGATSFNLPMTLQVYVEGMTPYEVEDQWMVKAKDTEGLSGTIPVKVNPDDPMEVAIDWDGVREQYQREENERRQALAAQGPVGDPAAAAAGLDAVGGMTGMPEQGMTPVLDISGDPELRAKLEQLLGRELTPGTSETVAENDPAMQMRIMQVVQEHMAQKAMGGSAPQAEDPETRLRKLGELRDGGLITPEEYEAKKDEILRDL